MTEGHYRWPCIYNIGNYAYDSAPEAESDIVIMFDWWLVDQDVVNNTSTINWEYKVHLKGFEYTAQKYYYLDFDNYTGIVIGNTGPGSTWTDIRVSLYGDLDHFPDNGSGELIDSTKIDGTFIELLIGETKTLASGTYVMPHLMDGFRNINFMTCFYSSGPVDVASVEPLTGGSEWHAYSVTKYTGFEQLPEIATHAIIYKDEDREVKDFTDEETVAINYAVPSGTTGYIYLSLDGNKYTETTNPTLHQVTGAGTHYFTFSASDLQKIWAMQPVTTKRVKFFIKSVSPIDGQEYREPSNDVNLSIANYMPTLDPDVWDNNTNCVQYLTGNSRVMVRHVSEPHFKTGGDPKKGASIEIQSCTHGGVTEKGATGKFTTVSGDATTANFDFIITDNYGRTNSGTTQFSTSVGNYVPYVKLTCSAEATPMTGDGDVTVTLTGKFFKGSFSSSKQNRMRMSMNLYRNNEEVLFNDDWGYIDRDNGYNASSGKQATFTYNASDSSYTYEFTLDNLEYLSVYELYITVSDEVTNLGSNKIPAQTILAAVPIFDWSRTDFAFYVPVTIQGASVPTIVAQGKSGIWTYRTWSDGTAECWGKKDVSVTFQGSSTAPNWGSLYTTGAISSSNISFPYGLFAETPIVNASLLIRSAGGILMAPGGAGSNIANMDQTGVYEIARGSYVSGTQYYTINYQVIGRWK